MFNVELIKRWKMNVSFEKRESGSENTVGRGKRVAEVILD